MKGSGKRKLKEGWVPWWGPNKDRGTKRILGAWNDRRLDVRERASLKARSVRADNDDGGDNDSTSYLYSSQHSVSMVHLVNSINKYWTPAVCWANNEQNEYWPCPHGVQQINMKINT